MCSFWFLPFHFRLSSYVFFCLSHRCSNLFDLSLVHARLACCFSIPSWSLQALASRRGDSCLFSLTCICSYVFVFFHSLVHSYLYIRLYFNCFVNFDLIGFAFIDCCWSLPLKSGSLLLKTDDTGLCIFATLFFQCHQTLYPSIYPHYHTDV